MRPLKTSITAIIILSASACFAQVGQQTDTSKAPVKELAKVETEASYPGGNDAWKVFIEKNIQINVPLKNKAPIGKYPAVVEFIVDKDGAVSNVTAVTKFDYGMEDELIRVIEKSGKWSPAMQNGKPLKAYRKQPVTFLVESPDFKINTTEPYTLFTNTDNEVTVTAKKIKAADLSITVSGGKVISSGNGTFIVRVSKPGRVTIEIVNNKKDDKEIGVVSFEVKAK